MKKSAVLTAAATVPGMAFAGERQHIQGNGTSQEGQHIHGNNTAGEASEGDGTERKLIDTPPMLQNYAAETLSITDRAYLLFEGKILFQGSSEELAENPVVREKYLGRNFVFRRKNFDDM